MAITRAQIARQLLAEGGSPGNTTFQLARKRSDGKRPGYYGPDAGEGGKESDFGAGTYSDGGNNPIDSGEAPGGTDRQFADARSAIETRSKEEKKAEKEKEKAKKAFEKNRFNYNRPNKFDKGLMRFISYMPTLSKVTGITPDYLKDQDEIATTIENLALGNRGSDVPSQYFGPVTDAAMSNFKDTVGGFPTTNTGGGGDGDNNYVPPVYVPPITADTAATTKEDEASPFTAQFTRASLTDADKARINEIGGLSIFAANGGRIGYDMGGEVMDQELQAGAPNLKIEGNQIPQEQEMASAPNMDAELYQLFMDALRKGDVPPGTTFDAYKQLMMQMMSQQQDEQMQPEMQEGIMQASTMQPKREMAAYGGIMGADGRRAYGFGSFFKSITRPFKKAAQAVKKVAKSPIGRAALLVGGAYLLGGSSALGGQGIFAKGQGLSRFSNLKNMVNFNKLTEAQKLKDSLPINLLDNKAPTNLFTKLFKTKGAIDPMKVFTGITLASAGAGLATKKQEEESLDDALANASRGESMDLPGIRKYIADNMGNVDPNEYAFLQPASYAAEGGRIGYGDGGLTEYEISRLKGLGYNTKGGTVLEPFGGIQILRDILKVNNYAQGGRTGANEGGMMNLGGNEMDLRGGGFVPLGAEEKADDVPARLSKNEFVFTADAVRAAGGGSVDKGAEKMYNTMKRLEGVVA